MTLTLTYQGRPCTIHEMFTGNDYLRFTDNGTIVYGYDLRELDIARVPYGEQ